MTFAVFEDEMARLGGLKFKPSELRTHWEALQDLPVEMLKAAVTRAQRTRVDFPTPVELRQDADAVAHLARELMPEVDRSVPAEPLDIPIPESERTLKVDRAWRYYCDVCSDSGMRMFWCGEGRRQPWIALAECERHKAHGGHEWVRRCECYDTNYEVQRKLAAQAKYAVSGAQKRAS